MRRRDAQYRDVTIIPPLAIPRQMQLKAFYVGYLRAAAIAAIMGDGDGELALTHDG